MNSMYRTTILQVKGTSKDSLKQIDFSKFITKNS